MVSVREVGLLEREREREREVLLNRTKKEDEQKRAKKEEQRVFWSSQEKIREISWEGHVLAKRKRVDGSRFRL